MAQIRKIDLLRMLLRSFYIQSTWNAERLLGLGFGFCLVPIARRLFRDRKSIILFMQRHLDFFNSHPYLATYALGAIANIEQQALVRGWEDTRSISLFKTRIIGPLGAIGDTLFWQLIRPACGVLGVVLLFVCGWCGAFVFFIVYNLIHLSIRIRGIFSGFAKGFDIVRELSLRGTKKHFQIMKYLFSMLLGGGIAIVVAKSYQQEASFAEPAAFLAAMIIAFLMMRKTRLSVDMLIIIIIMSAIIIGLMI
ncbi:MAG: PTS system mannose/fructose/sorbose family transporter subunit IID [candidate division KSB1 bacterium]|nr:PTS system mannose/fructose/sorbose family transporter subunit IID [candidate division KSB1 bacterium]